MSSILKSLRKIEKEQRAARQTAPDLMHDQGLAPVKSRPLLPLLAGIILGAMFVAGWGLWSSRETPQSIMTQPLPKAEEAAPAAMQIRGIASSGQTGTSADSEPGADSLPKNDLSGQLAGQPDLFSRTSTVTLSPQAVTVAGSQDAAKAKSAVNESVSKVLLPHTVQVPPAPLRVDTAAEATQSTAKAAVTVNARADQASVLPDGVSLQVSEIFYQQDGASSMAVVNDLPVMVGSQVDSAVVAEIRHDSIVFAIGDRTYVVDRSKP